MQRPTANDFDHASLEAMMERYRAELLRYQRATPPGKPTLAQNFEASEKSKSVPPVMTDHAATMRLNTEVQLRPAQKKTEAAPATQPAPENKKPAAQSEIRRERVIVDTPPIMLPTLTCRTDIATPSENVALPQTAVPAAVSMPVLVEVPPFNTALKEPRENPTQREPAQRQSQPPDAVDDASRQPLPPQQFAQVPKLAGAPIPQSVIDSMTGPSLQNSVPLPQTAANSTIGSVLPNTVMSPQFAANSIAEQAPQSVAALAAQSKALPRTPDIQPTPVPAKKERAAEPVQMPEPGCLAHTEFEKGTGAYGIFRPYQRMGKYTLASFLQTPGEAIQTLVRFAADVPTGSADAIRCRRSFTVKFFCREGEYDLFGMHLPVSVGATEKTLADCCGASRADPKTGLRSRAAFWEFLVTHREALHAALWLYSDLGTIGSYRTIDGYGLPCLWVNARNERRAVRPRWLSRQRPQTLTRFEAEELAGSDPDAVARDLVQSMQSGERPQYELSIQVIEPEQFAALPFDPFDPTAVWPTEQFKPQRIGLLTLERLPDDVLVELDIARFRPENIIPGIEHVPAPVKGSDDFTQVRQYLRSLGEFSRHRLIDNLSEELLRLPPLLLEQVLILLSEADLEFGQAMTLALGG